MEGNFLLIEYRSIQIILDIFLASSISNTIASIAQGEEVAV